MAPGAASTARPARRVLRPHRACSGPRDHRRAYPAVAPEFTRRRGWRGRERGGNRRRDSRATEGTRRPQRPPRPPTTPWLMTRMAAGDTDEGAEGRPTGGRCGSLRPSLSRAARSSGSGCRRITSPISPTGRGPASSSTSEWHYFRPGPARPFSLNTADAATGIVTIHSGDRPSHRVVHPLEAGDAIDLLGARRPFDVDRAAAATCCSSPAARHGRVRCSPTKPSGVAARSRPVRR